MIGGAAATYSAMQAMAGAEFSSPCYIRPFLTENAPPIVDLTSSAVVSVESLLPTGHTNCCGPFKNITRYGDSFAHCLQPGIVSQFAGRH